MADYTALTLRIYAWPTKPKRRKKANKAVTEALDTFGFDLGIDTLGPDVAGGETQTVATDVRLGSLSELVDILAPVKGLAFHAWEDPVYEFPGEWYAQTSSEADGGLVGRGKCGQDGDPYVTLGDLQQGNADGLTLAARLFDGLRQLERGEMA